MNDYEKSLTVLNDLFSKDCFFSLATVDSNNIPSARVIDTYYEDGVFWIVTYANSNKVKDIVNNPNIALCNNFHRLKGKAYNAGHPLKEENKLIREKLIKEFAPWYFEHNNENDENMCYVRFEPNEGFFHKDGKGYNVNFVDKTAKEIPFLVDED